MGAETDRQFRAALQAAARMDQTAIERVRAEGARARAEASQAGQKAAAQPAVVSVPALGPHVPAGMGERPAMAAGAQILKRLQALEADRWRVTVPVLGGDR